MGEAYISIRGRVLVNVEALNMTESVGNYVKHRRVPVILPKEEYITYFVPAVSGEAIAHGYQVVLAETANNNGLSVCKLCKKGIFLKSTNKEVLKEAFAIKDDKLHEFLGLSEELWNKMLQISKKKEKDRTKNEKEELQHFEQNDLPHRLEQKIIANCIVEDVGGFLYAEKTLGEFNIGGVKRTSNFYTGYMIPVKEALENVVIEPQLHSRYALGTPFVRGEAKGQMIYYVELSSAPYTFAFDLDSRYIGKATFIYSHAGDVVVEDRLKRVITAIDALQEFLVEFMFGAKKTRFLPVIEWESIAIAVSDDVWSIPSPFTKKYIEQAEKKLEKVNFNTKLYTYPNKDEKSFEEVVIEALEDAKSRISRG